MELFSGVAIAPNLLHHHPFGCPVYVLERKMQGRFKAPKWASRARLGVYLGSSAHYANNVGLVLSITTGLVSPQFHLKYDAEFTSKLPNYGNIIPPSDWQEKCGFLGDQGKIKSTKIDLHELSIVDNPPMSSDRMLTHDDNDNPPMQISEGETMPVSEGEQATPFVELQPPTIEAPVTTRSGRVTGPPSRYQDYVVYGVTPSCEAMHPPIDCLSPLVFAASSDPDVLYYHEARQAHDRDQFVKTMEDEIIGQTENGTWQIIKKSEVPEDARILPAVWAMRRKIRILDGSIYKWKARLNVDGGKQVQGLDYWETYAPPVAS
jgi:hypothetical protein